MAHLPERIFGFLARNTVLIVLFALITVFTVLTPARFWSAENIQNLASQTAFNAIPAFGVVLVLIVGGIDLSVGSVVAMAAALAVGLQDYGVPVAVTVAMLMGVGVGVLNGLLVTRLRIPAFIATLGTMTIVFGLLLTYTGQEPISGQIDWFTGLGSGNIGPVPVPTLIMVVILVVFQIMLKYTRFGHNLYAIGSNAAAAFQVGIKVDRHRMGAYVLSASCAALAGVMLAARLNSASIHTGQQTALLVITGCIMGGASILGGRGSAVGALLGILALGILGNGMNLLSVFTYQQLAVRAILFISVVAVDSFYTTTVRRRLVRTGAK